MSKDSRALGARLRALRVERGLTQGEIAKRLGCSQPLVARLETGAHEPRFDTVVRYAKALGVPMSDVYPAVDAGARR